MANKDFAMDTLSVDAARYLETNRVAVEGVGTIMKYLYLGIGWFFVALGTVGIFLPVLPTTPFLLISLWAFSKSSPRLHAWLITHPKAGPYLVAWTEYGVIPLRAKILAVSLMSLSWLYVTFFVADSWHMPVYIGGTMALVFCYILTKPNNPPVEIGQEEDLTRQPPE